MIGVDTTAIIDILNKKIPFDRVFEPTQTYCTTVFNVQEILAGLYPNEKNTFELLISSIIILDYTLDCVHLYSNVVDSLKQKGITVAKFDCMIASILLKNNCQSIITKSAKDFQKIPGLTIISY